MSKIKQQDLVYQVINKDGYMIHTNKELAQAVNETIKESGYKKTGSLINQVLADKH